MRKYHIFVFKDKKPFDNLILYKICTNDGVMSFDGFDHERGLYDCRLTFKSKKRRETVADFLAYKGFKYIYSENKFDLFLQRKAKDGKE